MLKDLLQLRAELDDEMAKIRETINKNEQAIQDVIADPLAQARELAGKDTGTVNVLIDGIKVKQAIAKRVDWDQKQMFNIWKRIEEAGDHPENYMTVKTTHGVKEKNYGSFPDPVKSIFSEARTVKAGAPKVTFE